MVSIEPLKCKMSYLFSDSCGGMFFPLSLSRVSSCFMLWKILLSFSIIRDVFFKAVEHSFHSNTLFLNTPERIVRMAGDREGHNVGRKTD